jgi:hypothetical protein
MRCDNFWPFSGDAIRAMFSGVMSEMYKTEVPQYRALLQLVADVSPRRSPGTTPTSDTDPIIGD